MVRRMATGEKKVQIKTSRSSEPERPTVLFVCVHNAGRSRMAEAFLDHMAGDRYKAISAGTQPAKRPHREVVQSMAEVGIPIAERPGEMLTQEMADGAVRVIGMGCAVEEACPALRVPLEDWELDDPKGKSADDVAMIRDLIEMRVRNLVAKLDAERTPAH